MLVISFSIFAGTYVYFLTQGGPTVSNSLPNLPADVFICDHFAFARAEVHDLGGGSRLYDVTGDCPVNAGALGDTYISELEYRGWTVHQDSSGSINAYSYGAHEQLTSTFSSSDTVPNQTTVNFVVATGQPVPAGFPSPFPSP